MSIPDSSCHALLEAQGGCWGCCRDAPLPGIAQWVASLFENIDLSPSDVTAALILAAASQQQRRKMRIKRALADKLESLTGRSSMASMSDTTDADTASEASSDTDDALSGDPLHASMRDEGRHASSVQLRSPVLWQYCSALLQMQCASPE